MYNQSFRNLIWDTDLSIRAAEASNWHRNHNSKKLTHVQHGFVAFFVACLIVFYRRLNCSSKSVIEHEHFIC